MNNKFILFTFVNLLLFTNIKVCAQTTLDGSWRAEIMTAGGQLPFQLVLTKSNSPEKYKVMAINGVEKLELDEASIVNDSIFITMDIFDATIKAKIIDNKMEGTWERIRSDMSILKSTFRAKKGDNFRFTSDNKNFTNVNGTYQVNFVSEDMADKYVAVGIFNQPKGSNKVTGTFLTTTGDYRYLEGNTRGDSLFLSCFDGTHLFLFKARKKGNTLNGQFWSGINSLENWTANLNPTAKLPDPTQLTYLKPNTIFDFSFPEPNGNILSLQDDRFKNKVTIVQILGSWCPNCMDETKYLAQFYKKNKAKNIEIIGLAFEKSTVLEESGPKIEKLRRRFGVDYPILLAGSNIKSEALKSLPMLNKVVGFPTTIFIDKKGKVRQIHTGFSGPGTGKYYDKWLADFNRFVDKLAKE